MKITKALDLWRKGWSLNVASEMAYRASFFLIVFSLIVSDLIGPLVGFFIYSSSNGIPGWTFIEFLLFEGVIIFVFGFWHTFIGGLSWVAQDLINEGEFDFIMLKPFYILMNIAALGTDFHGLTEVIIGLVLMVFAIVQLNLFGVMLIPFIILIILALIFMLSMSILLAALAVIFVKVGALQGIIWTMSDMVAYPLTIYTPGVRFFLTFILPAGIASYWPAAILVGKEPLSTVWLVSIPVFAFLAFSLIAWELAMRRYQSAGG